jgi:endogenous inhibitor of DNA gyrase (YacG/DUF329 family)
MDCPICKKPVDDATAGQAGSAYPFCSERCKLIDLGRWMSGKYQIPVKDADAEESDGPDEYTRRE